MHIDENINFNLNPGDVGGAFPGSCYIIPVEPYELTADEIEAQLRNYKLILVLMDRLADDGVDENYIIQAYQLVRDNHTSQKGKRRVPSDKGRELIITLYDIIAQYRDDVMQTRDFGPYPSREVYDLRCAMVDIIRMYDEYCAAIRDLIVPPMPQQAPATLAPTALPTAIPNDSAVANEPVTDDAVEGEEETAPAGQTADFSDMRIFTPVTEYNMSALYQFLIDEHVVVGVDEKQFADCINQANIKPLWETTESKNLFKLFVHTLKEYYKETYMQRSRVNPEWFLVCCESIDVTAEYMGKMHFPKKDTRVKFCENMKDSIKP